jgi:hypothetical protein
VTPGAAQVLLRLTLAVEAILDGEAEALTRKAVELAKSGDTTALRRCLERLAPPRKDRPVNLALPPLERTEDAKAGTAALLRAVAAGDVTPSEGEAVAKLIETHCRADRSRKAAHEAGATEGASGLSATFGARVWRRQ